MIRPQKMLGRELPVLHRPKSNLLTEIKPLIDFCRSGKLYEVEDWISAGKPIQCVPSDDPEWKKLSSPLKIAADSGFHSLAELLLVNGYDPNGDACSPLTGAVRSRNHSMVSLLLKFGSDPNACDFFEALETYDRGMMDRFSLAGANPCLRNAVARALKHKVRPLLGFVKSHWEQFPCLQRQVDIALNCFVESHDERGVALMLWLGANPHAQVPCSPYPEDEEYEQDCLESPFERSLWINSESTLEMFLKKPIPADRADYLMCQVSHRGLPIVVRRLLQAGADPNQVDEEGWHVLDGFISNLTFRWKCSDLDYDECGLEALEIVLEAGAKWAPSKPDIPQLRRRLLNATPGALKRIIELFKKYEVLSAEQIHELTRTAGMKLKLGG